MSVTQPVSSGLSEAEIDRHLSAVLAGQRMAGAEPTETDIMIARRQLRGELTADEAVALAIAAAKQRFQ